MHLAKSNVLLGCSLAFGRNHKELIKPNDVIPSNLIVKYSIMECEEFSLAATSSSNNCGSISMADKSEAVTNDDQYPTSKEIDRPFVSMLDMFYS